MRSTAVLTVRPGGLSGLCAVRLSWQEARPQVQVMYLLRFGTAALLTGGVAVLREPGVLLGGLSWLMAMWSVYTFNGVTDVVADRANQSSRPIARGALPADTAMASVYLLSGGALLLAALVSVPQTLLVVAVLAVGWAYSAGPRPGKETMSGFFAGVVLLGLLTFAAGAVSTGRLPADRNTVLFAVAMSAWMGCAGSTKDLSDVVGDRLAGRRTWPVVLGERRARLLIAACVQAVGWSFVVAGVLLRTDLVLAPVTVLAGAIVVAVALVNPPNARTHPRRPYRIFMTTQYVAHLVAMGEIVL